ncbi:hypothetical protein MNV49_005641 [Pseudohyphozyma bogoriensis]|nr:hypothetical protein MNV49_005641 [Pseudohyphozyma bogoriensis]
MMDFSSLLLPAFVGSNTLRSLVAFATLQSGIRVSSGVVTLQSELVKLVIALYAWRRTSAGGFDRTALANWRQSVVTYAGYSVPAALYLVNNLLYFAALRIAPPALVHTIMTAKVPLTAVFHHLLIAHQQNRDAWVSLAAMSLGLVGYAIPHDIIHDMWYSNMHEAVVDAAAKPQNAGVIAGVVISLVIAILSAGAGIYTEVLLKGKVDFWVAQIWLYAYGSLFSALSLLFYNPQKPPSEHPPSPLVAFTALSILVLTTSLNGMIISMILRKKDNLVKLVGTSACIATILVAQALIWESLRESSFSVQAVICVGIVTISSWTYNYYKGIKPKDSGAAGGAAMAMTGSEAEQAQSLLGDGGEGEEEQERRRSSTSQLEKIAEEKRKWFEPDQYKVAGAGVVVVLLAWLTQLRS